MECKVRICELCKDELPLTKDYFYKGKNGFKRTCRVCNYILGHLRYINNKDVILQKNKEYRDNNVEKRKSIVKKSYYKNISQYKEYYKNNKEKQLKFKRKNAESLILNSSKIFEYLKTYEVWRVDPSNNELGQVRCRYCGRWFNPTNRQCYNRKYAINNIKKSLNLYCSDNCKQSCPTYGQISYPKGFKKSSSREVNTVLRKIVLERDNYKCQKCGATTKEMQLHVHHIKSYAQNTMLKDDPDNCITLCKKCHKQVHKQDGCKYKDLRCAS